MMSACGRPYWWLVTAVAVIGCSVGEGAVVEVGHPVPAYAAVNLSGDTVSLGRLRGRPVLLNIWATWCAPCRIEIPYLEQLHAEHGGAGLEVIGVSIDSRGEEEKIGEFAREMGMTYPIWFDPDQRVTSVMLSFGVPASYLIGRDGVLLWRHLGVLRDTDREFAAALAEALRPLESR